MARMPAEERKQELIDIALQLFMERGYNDVSVQEILKVAKGQNGMFYHHFKSKDEIYNAALNRFIEDAAKARIKVITDKSIPFLFRLQLLCENMIDDSSSFKNTFGWPDDLSFLTEVLTGFIEALVEPVTETLLDAKKQGFIPAESIINEENAKAITRFLLNGSNGLVRGSENESADNQDAQYVFSFICEFLRIPLG